MRARLLFLLLLALVPTLQSCGSRQLCCVDEVARHRWDSLAGTRPDLLALARERVSPTAADKELVQGVMAACKLLAEDPDDGEAALVAAMGCFELRDRGTIPDWLWKDCIPFSETAVEQLPKDGAAHYTLALNVGLETQNQNPKDALLNIGWILSELDSALACDAALDDGGPQRVMALLYLRTPSWPTSIGDPEKGLELAHTVVLKYPQNPANHLALAEALLADGEYEGAKAEVAVARTLIDPAKQHWRAARHLKDADALERKARAALGEPAN